MDPDHQAGEERGATPLDRGIMKGLVLAERGLLYTAMVGSCSDTTFLNHFSAGRLAMYKKLEWSTGGAFRTGM